MRFVSSSLASLTLASLIVLAACGGSDGAPGKDGAAGPPGSPGTNDGGPTTTVVGADAGSPPKHAPQGIAFGDFAGAYDAIDGTIVVKRAADESDVTSYAVYYGKSVTEKLTLAPIFEAPADGSDKQFRLTLSAFPAGATQLIAVAKNAVGESTAVATSFIDRVSSTLALTIGAFNSGYSPSIAIDSVNSKLLVVTADAGNSGKPSLFRCNLDTTGCTYIDISAGAAGSTGGTPTALIDTTNSKLVVVATNGSTPQLFRCGLDGTGCTHADVSAGTAATAFSGASVAFTIDAANNKLLIPTFDGSTTGNGKLSLFRCNVDGTSCAYSDISGGGPANSGGSPSAAIDTVNNKLVVATRDQSAAPHLFRCNVDGTGCAHIDLTAGAGTFRCGSSCRLALDVPNGNFFVVAQDVSNGSKSGLLRCKLDGTACEHLDISAGVAAGGSATAAIDAVSGQLLVASDGFNALSLVHCGLDGTSCARASFTGISASQSGEYPSVAIDTKSNSVVVATTDGSNNQKLLLSRLAPAAH